MEIRFFISALATRLSQGFAVANPPKITFSFWLKVRNQLLVSSWTRGFPRLLLFWNSGPPTDCGGQASSNCLEFGFVSLAVFGSK